MVQKWIKIVRKENNKEEILRIIDKILIWDFEDLDVIKLSWKKWYFRCRIWKIRIIFFEENNKFYIDSVWYRWDIYK